jgi:hypothetical protein
MTDNGWHIEGCNGECLACLIEREVKKAYGNQGLAYLLRKVQEASVASLRDEQAKRIAELEAEVAAMANKNHDLANKLTIAWNKAPSPEAFAQEVKDADDLFRLLNLDPQMYRTDCGYINLPKVKAALKNPEDYPRLADATATELAMRNAPDILTLRESNQSEVIRVAPDGRIFWHGREVETDDDFRAAMLDLAVTFKAMGWGR